MVFVSHAQNGEDVLLWRALADFGPGFYIDVGAGDPVAESVTKAFYDAGWRGINIEPMAESMALLREERPRDINLHAALEDVATRRCYYSIDGGNGLSTGVKELAAGYADLGREVAEVEVEVLTLVDIFERFVREEVLFLKIDVEGKEAAVIRGGDFTRFRPWVVVIEVTSPVDLRSVLGEQSGEPTGSRSLVVRTPSIGWEADLIAAGYSHVFFDGLNRYYVADEKVAVIGDLLTTPPNVFDDFVRVREVEERERRAALEDERDALLEAAGTTLNELSVALADRDAELSDAYQVIFELSRHIASLAADVQRRSEAAEHQLDARVTVAEQRAEATARELSAVYATRAWRATGPLRRLRALLPGAKRD